MHTIPADLRDMLALMQDTIFQAIHHDGFRTPSEPLDIYYFARPVARLFPKADDSYMSVDNAICSVSAPEPMYEHILFADLLGQLLCEADALVIHYTISDTYKGSHVKLSVSVRCKHPEPYREALAAAGAIVSTSYDSIQCGV